MSLRQIQDSYFHLTYFSLPLLFFIYYLINDLVFEEFFLFKTLLFFFGDPMCDPMRDPIRDPVRDPIRDPVRDPVRDPIRDPVRPGPIQILSTPLH